MQRLDSCASDVIRLVKVHINSTDIRQVVLFEHLIGLVNERLVSHENNSWVLIFQRL